MRARKCYGRIDVDVNSSDNGNEPFKKVRLFVSFLSTAQRQLAGEYIEDEGYTLFEVTKPEMPFNAPVTHFPVPSRNKLIDLICSAM